MPDRVIDRNLTLDLGRILACLWLWLYHWTGNAATWSEYSKSVKMSFSFIPEQIEFFLNFGFLGTIVLLVLSGRVISNSVLRKSPIAFAKSRFTRLFPAYLIASLITIPLYGLAGGERGMLSGLYWLTGFPLLSNSRPYIGPAWTLHYIIWFYVFVFLILKVGKDRKKNLIIFTNISSFVIFFGLIICYFTQTLPDSRSLVILLPYFLFGMFTQLLDSAKSWKYSSLGFFVSSLLVIYAIHHRIGSKSYLPAFIAYSLIVLFLIISKLEIVHEWSPPKCIQIMIRKAAAMTYPIYLLHLTAGGALISYLYGNGVPIWFSIFLSGFFVTFVSWWIVQIFEPKINARLKSLNN